jgi:hypothetical protein
MPPEQIYLIAHMWYSADRGVLKSMRCYDYDLTPVNPTVQALRNWFQINHWRTHSQQFGDKTLDYHHAMKRWVTSRMDYTRKD